MSKFVGDETEMTEKIARALCRAAGGSPEVMVRPSRARHRMNTPIGEIETVGYPDDIPEPLWHYWLHSAREVEEAIRK